MPELPRAYLFGGPHPWSQDDWTSSDDRVRGGSSYSTLVRSPTGQTAAFQGNLDIETLGGAGFASQRTTGERCWDLSAYDGLELNIDEADSKLYTLTLKNEILPKRPDGREQSSVSWEIDFRTPETGKVVVKWAGFKATYRGREMKKNPPCLDLTNIKRMSIMMRSFFGTQHGDFSLRLVSIAACRGNESKALDNKG
ncbi:hypothetical protein ARAM_001564, partial [Aspergillus rambellii]